MAKIRVIEAEATKTAAYTASVGLDISALSASDFNFIKIRVRNLAPTSGAASKNAILSVQHVAAADFTAPVIGPTFNVAGNLTGAADLVISIPARDYPTLPVGTALGKVRVALTTLDASATITYMAWME
jgi:hypothetical protein